MKYKQIDASLQDYDVTYNYLRSLLDEGVSPNDPKVVQLKRQLLEMKSEILKDSDEYMKETKSSIATFLYIGCGFFIVVFIIGLIFNRD